MLSRDHRQRMTQKQDSNPPILKIGQMDDRPQYGLNTLFLNRGDFRSLKLRNSVVCKLLNGPGPVSFLMWTWTDGRTC